MTMSLLPPLQSAAPLDFASFMSGGGWAFFALVATVFSAGFYLVNQYLRQPGDLLVFWMRALIVLFMTPLMFTLDWPQHPAFYAAVALTVVVGTSSDVRTFNVTAKYGAGVVSRVMPATVLGAFILWLFFRPAQLMEYLAQPLLAAGVLTALAGCVWFATRLNRCHITKSAMVDMAPALLGYTLTTVLNKYAMEFGAASSAGELGALPAPGAAPATADFAGVVYTYMYVQSVLALGTVGPFILWQRRKASRRRPAPLLPEQGKRMLFVASLLAAVVWICHMIYKNYGMAYTPNPSYLAAIGLTAPVMISVFYKITGHREEADIRAGMGIVACALLLVVVTAFK